MNNKYVKLSEKAFEHNIIVKRLSDYNLLDKMKDKVFKVENSRIIVREDINGEKIFSILLPSDLVEEVSFYDYIASINLKEKLIELANSDKYAIYIPNKAEAEKLDKLFKILGHKNYSNRKDNRHSLLQDWLPEQNKWYIDFELTTLSPRVNDSTNKIQITIKELLDYV